VPNNAFGTGSASGEPLSWVENLAGNGPGLWPNWCAGEFSANSSIYPPNGYNPNSTDHDETNTAYLSNPNFALIASTTGKSVAMFKCPSDPSRNKYGPRVRSYSMNGSVGPGQNLPTVEQLNVGKAQLMGYANPYAQGVYSRITQIPNPADEFVMVEENFITINDACLFVSDATGSNPNVLLDCPGVYHSNGTCFNFADGHSEVHQWLNSTVMSPFNLGQIFPANTPDLVWLEQHANWMGN
jgi:hypothetical protein